MSKSIQITRKIGRNRGVARLWIEGKSLLEMGWKRGDKFNAIWAGAALVYVKQEDCKRKVAGTDTRPIIDTNTDKLLDIAQVGDYVQIEISHSTISVRL